MKRIDAKKVLNLIDSCRLSIENLTEEEVDKKKYISIEYLHKSLVDALYNGELPEGTMSVYHWIIAKWENSDD